MKQANSSKTSFAILFDSFGPYHVARIEALAELLRAKGIPLHAYQFFGKSDTYLWAPVMPSKDIETVTTLSPHNKNDFLSCLQCAIRLLIEIRIKNISIIFFPSYSPFINTLSLLLIRLTRCRPIMLNETWELTVSNNLPKNLMRSVLMRLFYGAVVGGSPHTRFTASYGISAPAIFPGYDTIDNDFYKSASTLWNSSRAVLSSLDRQESLCSSKLPSNFILSLGRFVKKKNLSCLIEAYHQMVTQCNHTSLALVIVGSGVDQTALQAQAHATGQPTFYGIDPIGSGPRIIFYPFQQLDGVSYFFAKATVFVLPSLCEEWGLVVNESLAAGTPVVVSKNAGCAEDLVINGYNGYTFDPSNVHQLAKILGYFANDLSLSEKLSINTSASISYWNTRLFARNCSEAASIALGDESNRTRLLFIVASIAESRGGTSLEVVNLANILSTNYSYDIIILTCDDKPPHLKTHKNVRVIRLKFNNQPMTWINATWQISRCSLWADTIFTTGIWGPFDGLAVKIAISKNKRHYIRVCGMLQPYILAKGRLKKAIGRLLYVNSNLSNASGLIVNSDKEKSQVKKLYPNSDILLMRNGQYSPPPSISKRSARRHLDIIPAQKVLLYLGRIHPKKGLLEFLQALSIHIKNEESSPPILVLVAGSFSSNEYREKIEILSNSLLGSERIRFLGSASGQFKEILFAASDLFILPSYSEGLPNAVIEAMHRSLPAVITTECNLPELEVSGSGIIVSPTLSGFIESLRWIDKTSRDELTDLGENAKALASSLFSIEQTAESYHNLIRGEGGISSGLKE